MAYTDLTATFVYRKLMTWQLMDQLAENDAYDRIPVGTVKFFYQAAAPTGWTKLTSQNDKALRVVSGSGGGAGGSLAVSTGINLAHSHTVNSHTHSQPNHTHTIDYDTVSSTPVATSQTVHSLVTSISTVNTGGSTRSWPIGATATDGGGGATGAATPGTDTQLGTVTLAYVDVIACSKN